jgi:hypothetical protein
MLAARLAVLLVKVHTTPAPPPRSARRRREANEVPILFECSPAR